MPVPCDIRPRPGAAFVRVTLPTNDHPPVVWLDGDLLYRLPDPDLPAQPHNPPRYGPVPRVPTSAVPPDDSDNAQSGRWSDKGSAGPNSKDHSGDPARIDRRQA